MTALPPTSRTLFAEQHAPGAQQLETWRNHVAHLWDVDTDRDHVPAFTGTSRCDHLGAAILGQVEVQPMRMLRSRPLIARMGLDHVFVQLRTSGHLRGRFDTVEAEAGPGDICIYSMARPIDAWNTQYGGIGMLMPRMLLTVFLSDPDALHGLVLRCATPTGSMLADHLRAVTARISRFSLEESAAVARGTVALLAHVSDSAMRNREASPDALAHGAAPALLNVLCHFIDTHLADRGLTAERIGARFGLSRTAVYRLFEPLGGVAGQVRRRRLLAARRDLQRPGQSGGTLEQIAGRWQLGSAASFSRAFVREFGRSPGSLRQGPTPAPMGTTPDRGDLYDWAITLEA